MTLAQFLKLHDAARSGSLPAHLVLRWIDTSFEPNSDWTQQSLDGFQDAAETFGRMLAVCEDFDLADELLEVKEKLLAAVELGKKRK